MKIRWLGHSSFLLTNAAGRTVLTDPFDPGMVGYSFCPPAVDIVTVSHRHGDHSFLTAVPGFSHVISATGEHTYGDITVVGFPSFHDECGGSKRGDNIIFKIVADGISVVHMGDIGEPCTPKLAQMLAPVDVLLIPVGGTYTVDAEGAARYAEAIEPAIIVPMHYSVPGCRLDISPVDRFLSAVGKPVERADELDITKRDPSGRARIVVLNKI